MRNSRNVGTSVSASAATACILATSFIALSLESHAAGRRLVTLEVDAREASRGLERAHLRIPVRPGPLTVLYPKWIPGEHMPNGPIASLGGLRFSAAGHVLTWHRDALDMNALHLSIPSGATQLEVDLEITLGEAPAGLSAPMTSTPALAVILWQQLLLYPVSIPTDDIDYQATLVMPSGWTFASALHPQDSAGDRITFEPETLTVLADSPVLIGQHLRTIELGGPPAVFLHLAADSAAALEIKPETVNHYKALLRQAQALYGGTHYRSYHFLWALTDNITPEGIEHHESSDNRSPLRTLVDDDIRRAEAPLLAHEYTHSWNGKYRRPADMVTRNLNEPIRTELLWVYEGLTEYLSQVLAVRSGLLTEAEFLQDWALIAADMEAHRGRQWRSLQDVAVSAQIEYNQSRDWLARTRGTDFYSEAALLWLEADVLIRRESGGRRSLDDFCKAFLGGITNKPQVKPYDEDEIFALLNAVQPFDWRAFWHVRLQRLRAGAPLDGLESSGWRVVYDNEPSIMQRAHDTRDQELDLRHSLGFKVAAVGALITDVVPGSPADLAGVPPASTLVALNERRWSKDVLHDILQDNAGRASVSLLIQKADLFRTFTLQYAGGERYPRLERDARRSDVLTEITRPR